MLAIVTRVTPPCPACTEAKLLLKSKGVTFKEVPLSEVKDNILALGIRSIPAVFKDQELIIENYLGSIDYVRTIKPE